jgi:hypothetical protein
MSFKIGDEVVMIVNNPSGGCLHAGDTGIIRAENGHGISIYAVEFEFDFTDSHTCDNAIQSGNGWFINAYEMELNKYSRENLYQQKQELLKALRDLNSVKSEPWTDEQRQLKFKVGCEVEDILKKYESEVIE